MPYFTYGDTETRHLALADPCMAQWIEQVGTIQREVIPDPFAALLSSIISQQISGKAAQTIWARFVGAVGSVDPDSVLAVSEADLRGCGLSGRKAEYVQGIAAAAKRGDIAFSDFQHMRDDDIIRRLVELKGVGVWTAEMLLIFSLERPDVLSFADLGIRRGLMRLHHLDDLSEAVFDKYRNMYSPYGSTASLYLWELAAQTTAKDV